MKKLSAVLFFIVSISVLLSSCRDVGSESSREESHKDVTSVSESLPESIAESEAINSEPTVIYIEKYEIEKSCNDNSLYLVKRENKDKLYNVEYAVVTADNEVLYDFDFNLIRFEQVEEDLFLISTSNDEVLNSALVDSKKTEIIPFGLYSYIQHPYRSNWAIGHLHNGNFKAVFIGGETLGEEFLGLNRIYLEQFYAYINNKSYVLMLRADGSHEMIEYNFGAVEEKYGDNVKEEFDSFYNAIRENDLDYIKSKISTSAYEKLETALKNEALIDPPNESWFDYKGIDFLALMLINRDRLTDTIKYEKEENYYINVGRNGISTAGVIYFLDDDYMVPSSFALKSDGNGNFTFVSFDGFLE
ncbi:MAG: hypothetical protein PHY15_06930 [Eubacteriales bacterium]|nr:hypothetical protein [Eubacteriales bacterium]MDD4475402.1 hypothetical protein [Eubacteriales bacterium]